jgi:hypothetical protein
MAIDQRRAIVRAEILLATEPFQSKEGTRFYLQGTNITPQENGVILSATDGHTFVSIQQIDSYATGLPTVWNCDAKRRLGSLLAKVRKNPACKAGANLWVDLQKGQPGPPTMTAKLAHDAKEILDGGGDPLLMIIGQDIFVDGSFPDTSTLFSRQPSHTTKKPKWGGPFALQSVYLHRAANLAKALGTGGKHSVCFGALGPDDCVTVTIPGRPDVVCLFMPIRAEAPPVIPDWIAGVGDAPETEEVPVTEAA